MLAQTHQPLFLSDISSDVVSANLMGFVAKLEISRIAYQHEILFQQTKLSTENFVLPWWFKIEGGVCQKTCIQH